MYLRDGYVDLAEIWNRMCPTLRDFPQKKLCSSVQALLSHRCMKTAFTWFLYNTHLFVVHPQLTHIVTIKAKLKEYIWNHFVQHFDDHDDNHVYCTYHYLYPCSKCHDLQTFIHNYKLVFKLPLS